MAIDHTCSNCAHYQQVDADPRKHCVARPPLAVVMLIPSKLVDGEPLMHKHTFFPSPEPTWSCGEHCLRN